MTTKFVTTTIDDKPGQLGRLARYLAEKNVNIEAFEAARGEVCLVTNDPDKAAAALQAKGYHPKISDTLEVQIPNKPGELATIGEALGKANVNIVHSFGSARDGRIYLEVDNITAARPIVEKFSPTQVSGMR